jgi:hypothetical protein
MRRRTSSAAAALLFSDAAFAAVPQSPAGHDSHPRSRDWYRFRFLLFSLIVTAANEIWLSLLDKRAAFLREGLTELLHGNGNLVAAVLNHGLVSSMSRGVYDPAAKVAGAGKQIVLRVLPGFVWRKLEIKTGTEGVPSYIPGKSFVLAIISLLPQAPAEAVEKALERLPAVVPPSGDDAATIIARLEAARRASAELRASIEALPASKLRASFLALYDDAKGDLDRFKANLENWFNESMDRVGGWYKRYAQQWLFTLALVLAIVCNVDSIRIIRAFSANPKLVENVIEQAGKYLDANPPAVPAPVADSSGPKTDALRERVRAFNNSVSELGATGIRSAGTVPRRRS